MDKNHYIITIARQFGSLGRPIAKDLARKLNIEYYDRDLLDLASREMGKPMSEIGTYDEHTYSRMEYPLGMGDASLQKQLFDMQKCVIAELAMRNESCIIVGRCSDYILRHYNNVLSIYIYAPLEVRIENCVNILGMDPKEVRKTIKNVDKARDRFYQKFTELPGAVCLDYRQAFIDSSMLGVEGTVELLETIVRKRFPECMNQES